VYTISGLSPIKFATIAAKFPTIAGVADLGTGAAFVTDINYLKSHNETFISWTSANINLNIFDDFAQSIVFSVLNDNDLIIGNSFSDTIKSGNGSDIIFGKLADDFLFGESGNDFIYGNHGLDTISGGLGDDVLYGGQNSGALSGGVGTAGDGILKQRDGIEFLSGNEGNDVIYGNYGSDLLYGGTGNDALFGGQDIDGLFGGAGADTLNGNRGDDILVGGSGADVFVLAGTGANLVTDFSGAEGDRIDATSLSDVIISTTSSGNALLVSGSNLSGVSIELLGVSMSQFDTAWII
jgi:Ca2+-binding RTX toxin-like protein